jgi:very-short-patch-repair endonuclease
MANNSFIVDFVFLKQNLIIELDGGIHEVDDNPKYDEYRTQELNAEGFRMLRFKNEEVSENVDEVLKTILYYLKNVTEHPSSNKSMDEYSPSPSERGWGDRRTGEVFASQI